MTSYQATLNQLIEAICKHDSIIAYQKAHDRLMQTSYHQKAYQMKRHQQDSHLFQKISKNQAAKVSETSAKYLEAELNSLPLIVDYRDKMQDASDLLQYITKTIENKLNKEITNGNS
ncbi:YlbF family regulator [Streptococcus phocae subsp. phocae]